MSSSAQKAAANGLIGMAFAWAIFTAWMVIEVYTGMSGEEFVWMVVLPIPFAMIVCTLGTLAVPLGFSFHRKRTSVKVTLIVIAAGLQIVLSRLVAKIDFSDDGSSSPSMPFWMGSIVLWLIAIATHAYITTQTSAIENNENLGFD